MTEQDCIAKYGPISNGLWDDESKHCRLVELPEAIQNQVKNTATGGAWIHVYCNLDMKEPLLSALNKVVIGGYLKELETFDGCFMIRPIRGTLIEMSAHSWAMAIDLNAKKNPLGGESKWSPEFVECFTSCGFTWGGNFHRKDPQHFSMAGF